jgi:hypothetical protein
LPFLKSLSTEAPVFCIIKFDVADPGCLSRILMSAHHKYYKIKNYFIFELAKKKIRTNLERIVELLIPKIVIKFSKI